MFCITQKYSYICDRYNKQNFKIMKTQKTVREIRTILFNTEKFAIIDSVAMTNKEARDFLYNELDQDKLFTLVEGDGFLNITKISSPMTAIFKTKSNFKNCNNKPLEVVEITGTRISVLIPRCGFGLLQGEPIGEIDTVADFNIKELISFGMNAYKKQ